MSLLANQVAVMLETMFNRIRYADSSDFGVLAVTVIVSIWYVNRYVAE